MENNKNELSPRRKFLKFGLLAGGATLVGLGIQRNLLADSIPETGKKVKLMTADGKLVEVDSSHVNHHISESVDLNQQAREGIEGRKFIKVIDLARCANARKCIQGCQEAHNRTAPVEFLKVIKMQDTKVSSPYWMVQGCNHCDNPPCTKVCPVDATFKRKDGIVLIDNDRCIGCRFCMAACPYSARSFNWGENWGKAATGVDGVCHSPIGENNPVKGTVQKCDFCPELTLKGELPACVQSCPNGTIFFGDENEDTVSNGEETFRLSELIRDRSGYRYLEELGTEPRVYYLPPVERNFPFEEDKEIHNSTE
jgi:molybdopterin-containing oxidoreductase family iron-sulfur binding subunit